MNIEDILINIGNYNDTINDMFPNKDLITITDLVNKLDDLRYEIEKLKEDVEDKENEIKELKDFYVYSRY